jgi:hypothetical protein
MGIPALSGRSDQAWNAQSPALNLRHRAFGRWQVGFRKPASVIYWLWIRPILSSRRAFRQIHADEKSFFAAAREKLKG